MSPTLTRRDVLKTIAATAATPLLAHAAKPRRTVAIIDSHGLVETSVRLSRPRTPSRVTVSVSGMPSRSDAAAPG